MAKSRQARLDQKKDGQSITLHEHNTDSPLIPIQVYETMHSIRPDWVDEMWDQTKQEAEHRRKIEVEGAESERRHSEKRIRLEFFSLAAHRCLLSSLP